MKQAARRPARAFHTSRVRRKAAMAVKPLRVGGREGEKGERGGGGDRRREREREREGEKERERRRREGNTDQDRNIIQRYNGLYW